MQLAFSNWYLASRKPPTASSNKFLAELQYFDS